jgi:hypothetical protein
MKIDAEQQLRSRVAALPLEWIELARGDFEGDRREDYADLIAAAHIVSDEARLALHRWIDAGRRAGLSWTEIGATLGISKQAAQQRFGAADDAGNAAAAAGKDADIEVRLGATAFNELRILEEEGRRGRELVGTGALRLFFRQTRQGWEYRRVVAASPAAAQGKLVGKGWSHVSSWLPFHYFKRPDGALAD